MPDRNAVVRALHDLGLAAWFGSRPLAQSGGPVGRAARFADLRTRSPSARGRRAAGAPAAPAHPRQRDVLVLRIAVGLSAKETAQVVGSAPDAVRVTRHRALNRLRGVVSGPLDVDPEDPGDCPVDSHHRPVRLGLHPAVQAALQTIPRPRTSIRGEPRAQEPRRAHGRRPGVPHPTHPVSTPRRVPGRHHRTAHDRVQRPGAGVDHQPDRARSAATTYRAPRFSRCPSSWNASPGNASCKPPPIDDRQISDPTTPDGPGAPARTTRDPRPGYDDDPRRRSARSVHGPAGEGGDESDGRVPAGEPRDLTASRHAPRGRRARKQPSVRGRPPIMPGPGGVEGKTPARAGTTSRVRPGIRPGPGRPPRVRGRHRSGDRLADAEEEDPRACGDEQLQVLGHLRHHGKTPARAGADVSTRV